MSSRMDAVRVWVDLERLPELDKVQEGVRVWEGEGLLDGVHDCEQVAVRLFVGLAVGDREHVTVRVGPEWLRVGRRVQEGLVDWEWVGTRVGERVRVWVCSWVMEPVRVRV